MVLYYNEDNAWTIPNDVVFELLMYMKEDNKKYFALKKLCQIVFTLSKMEINWTDNNYINFIGELPLEFSKNYKTIYTNNKHSQIEVSKENCEQLKTDIHYLKNILTEIICSMILDKKRKLKWSGANEKYKV